MMIDEMNNKMEIPRSRPPSGLFSSVRNSVHVSKSSPAVFRRSTQGSLLESSPTSTNSIPATARSTTTIKDGDLSSDELRDVFFKEWSERKKREILHSAEILKEQRTAEKKAALDRQAERQEKCRRYLEKWMQNKEALIEDNQKLRKQMEKEKTLIEEETKAVKIAENETVCKAWLEQKKVKLKEIRQKKLLSEQKEMEKKKEEKEQKTISSNKAFEAWAARKQTIISAKKKEEKTIEAKILTERLSQEQEKNAVATSAYESWKKHKDNHIKFNTGGKLYTYNPNPREPPKLSKWYPARSVKYDYPSLDKPKSIPRKISTSGQKAGSTFGKIKSKVTEKPLPVLDETYSLDDFESIESIPEEDSDT